MNPVERRPQQQDNPSQQNHLDERLDEALTESFPASDPPAVHTTDDSSVRRHSQSEMTEEEDPDKRPRDDSEEA
jgi:hypothetical protein